MLRLDDADFSYIFFLFKEEGNKCICINVKKNAEFDVIVEVEHVNITEICYSSNI